MTDAYDLNTGVFSGYLVWIEVERDGDNVAVADVSKEILGMAADMGDARVWGVIFGHNELKPLYGEIFSCGAETLYEVHGKDMVDFDAEIYAKGIGQVAERTEAAIIFLGDDEKGRLIAPRIPVEKENFISGCDRFPVDACRSEVLCNGAKKANTCGFPKVVTIKPGSYPVPDHAEKGAGTVLYWKYKD